jgi:hypothetical protein
MPNVTMPNGFVVYDVPAGTTQQQLLARLKAAGYDTADLMTPPQEKSVVEDYLEEVPLVGGLLTGVADIGLGAVQGVAGGIGAATKAFGADTSVSNFFDDIADGAQKLISAEERGDLAAGQLLIKEAEDKGVLDQVIAAAKAFSKSPLTLTAQALGSVAPIAAATAITGGAAAPVALSGLMGAGAVKGGIYDAVEKAAVEKGIDPKAAKAMADEAQSYLGENVDQVALGTVLGVIAGRFGLEPAIARVVGKELAERSVLSAAGRGVVAEAVPEAAQAGQERMAQNIALQREGYDVPTMRGVAGQAALEGIMGGVPGGILGAFDRAPAAGQEAPTTEEVPGAPTPSMEDIAARAFTNPDDKAAFDALVKQFSDEYGIPEDEAARLAMGALRPTGPAAPVTEAPAAEAPTTPTVPEVIPPIENVTPEAQLRKQLAGATPPPTAAPVEPTPAPAAAPPAPIEAAPVAAPEPVAPPPVAEAAPVPMASPVVEVAPTAEITAPVPEEAAPVVLALPEAKKKVTPERITAATEMLNQTLATPEFEGVEITPKELNKAAQKMARMPGLEAPAALTDVLGIDTMQAQEEALAAEPVAPEPAPEPVLEAPTEVEATEVSLPEEAEPMVAAEPTVPVTKVAPGDARGARPVQRGAQGVLKGRPVEGAAELTPGMQDEQALTERLRNMRMANLMSDQDVAEVMRLVRPPASKQALDALPEAQKSRWLQVQNLTSDMEAKAEQRDAATGKKKAELNEAVKAVGVQLDEVRSQLAKYAMGDALTRIEQRKAARAQVEADFKAGKIGNAERKRRLGEMRIERPMGEALQEKWYTELDPNEAATVQAGLEGKSFEDALKWVIDNAPNEAYRTIAEAVRANAATLSRAGWKFDFRIAHVGDPIPASMYKAMGMTRMSPSGRKAGVILHGADVEGKVGTSFETFLHEAIHAVAMPLIKAGNYKRMQEYRFSKATQDLIAVSNHITQEFNKKVRSGMPLTSLEEAIYKRTTNVIQKPDEVLAWAMTNPEVMAYFDTIQYTPKQTVFSRIVEIVRNVLGLAKNTDSALAEILRAGETLLSATATEAKAASDFLAELSLSATTSKQQVEADKKASKGLRKAQLANNAEGFTEGLDEVTASVKLTAGEKSRAVYEGALAGTLTPAKLKLTPTSWIRDAVVKMRPGLGSILEGIDKLEQGLRGMRTSMERAMQRRVDQVEKFVNDNGQEWLAMTMHLARVNRVDVTAYATRDEALKNDPVLQAHIKNGNAGGERTRKAEINDTWDAWEKLGEQKGGHETYKRMRQFYKDMYAALRAAQDEDIRNLGLDREATERLIREARGDVDEDALVDEGPHKGVKESLFPAEYFPFRRFGEYVLIVQNGKRAERERYHFESIVERNLFAEKRAKQLGLKRGTKEYEDTIRPSDELDNLRDDMTQESFLLSKLFAAVEETKVPEGSSPEEAKKYRQTLKDRLYQTYLMTLPERSLRKQFIHAELVTGQSADVLRVFRVAASQYTAQLPKVVYGGRIQTQIEAAYDTLKEGDPLERQQLTSMVNTIVSRTREAIDPDPRSALEQVVSELTFVSLMTSVASALVQPLTLPLQVLPRMISRYGLGQALKMVGGYTPLLSIVEATRDVDPVTGEASFVAPTLGNTEYIKNNPLRARLWKELDQKRDLFSQKQTDMLLRNRATSTTKGILAPGRFREGYEKVVHWSGALFSSADQITREISGMSFAELEYNKLRKAGKSHEQAIEGAVNASVRNTNETVGNYTEAEKIDVFRGGPLRRMIGFLRTYSVQRTAYYFRMLGAMFKGSPTQTRLEAFNELSMVLVFTGAAAGVGANFGYSFITTMIDVVLGAMLDDEEKEEWRKRDPLGADDSDYRFRFQWLPEQFGPDSMVTRIAQRGVLSELTGYDWTTRLSQSSMWLRDSRGGETLREDIFNFLSANLSPQFSQGVNIIDGIDEFMNGNWSKGFTKIMPAAVRGMFTAERFASEGETTKAGLTVAPASEFSGNELFGQVLGFAPNDLAKEREMNRMTQAWKNSMKEERGKLFKEFREVRDDPEATQEDRDAIIEKIRAYNRKVPLDKSGRPLKEYLIRRSNLSKSVEGRESREKRSYRGVEYAPGERDLFFPYNERKPVVE